MKLIKLAIASLLFAFVVGCAETPDLTTQRFQLDDLGDNDQDGVINERDLCQNTPSYREVDHQGCTQWWLEDRTTVITIEFDFDKSVIRDDQLERLSQIENSLKQNGEANVILLGNTSPEGTDNYNQNLARKRSAIIRDALIGRGIDSQRIQEQEYYQITSLTEKFSTRARSTIAVITNPELLSKEKWDIFTSERIITGEVRDE